jgi:hypothetical protein
MRTDPIHLEHYCCLRCAHAWVPRKSSLPLRYPKCHSPYWNRPRRHPAPEPILSLEHLDPAWVARLVAASSPGFDPLWLARAALAMERFEHQRSRPVGEPIVIQKTPLKPRRGIAIPFQDAPCPQRKPGRPRKHPALTLAGTLAFFLPHLTPSQRLRVHYHVKRHQQLKAAQARWEARVLKRH